MKKAIYAASLDPITKGHVNLIQRALKVFGHIIVAIGINEAKKPLFTLQEREEMARKELACFGNKVRVCSFEGMLSDFAYENNVETIIRGARSTPDFDYEKLIGDINRYCGVDTVIYTSTPEMSHISSSAAKAITLNAGKNMLDFVSMDVKRKLEEKLLYQYRIGVTGMIGSGKNTVADKFSDHICYIRNTSRDSIHIIDMDTIGHYILEKGTEPVCVQVRNQINMYLKGKLMKNDGYIDVSKLSAIIFKDYEAKLAFDRIMIEPMTYMLRKELLSKKGTKENKSIVLILGALLCEANGLSEFNNNLILVDAPEKDIVKRLKEKRGYSADKIKQRMGAQLTLQQKYDIALGQIKLHDSGNAWIIKNGNKESTFKTDKDFEDILRNLNFKMGK